ncbi:tyrosine-type recombinase/integrase [Paraburkholderia sp. CNPSo 3157]|uniref:Tyrosine-type recombinase/integrase n=1 Tax=Paraburkholderia franconis TaxID=2654983 RepID=A0A7X1TI73_9BURK|nr:site-specific integrase [Paraburkholderia franconis]MPW20096.1 tyrosine-type recombinase/integrase [Paraburkholderia franconis]
MASIYPEGAGWAVRNRSRNDTFYQAGFATRAKAQAWLNKREKAIEQRGRPFGLGPEKTTLAQALADYLPLRVPYLKSGDQLCRRINRFIRYGRLPTYQTIPVARRTHETRDSCDRKTVYFELERVPYTPVRVIPQGLGAHRAAQARQGDTSERVRERLACTKVADITRHHIQPLIHALQQEGKAAQTIAHEQAVLREFFNFVKRQWNWVTPAENPAAQLEMPDIDNARDRVLTPDEQERLEAALRECRNPYVAPFIGLLLETAMRQSELLVTAQWRDVDWSRRVLRLWDAKSGGRDVPLTQGALDILNALPRGAAEDRVFPMTLSALNAAWYRAIERAGLENLHKHDLKHCAVTRFAGLLQGDIFLLKVFSGHKTLSQLVRYVNPKVEDALQAVDAAQAARKAPLHARGPTKHPSAGDVLSALDAAAALDVSEASSSTRQTPDALAAAGPVSDKMPTHEGTEWLPVTAAGASEQATLAPVADALPPITYRDIVHAGRTSRRAGNVGLRLRRCTGFRAG